MAYLYVNTGIDTTHVRQQQKVVYEYRNKKLSSIPAHCCPIGIDHSGSSFGVSWGKLKHRNFTYLWMPVVSTDRQKPKESAASIVMCAFVYECFNDYLLLLLPLPLALAGTVPNLSPLPHGAAFPSLMLCGIPSFGSVLRKAPRTLRF